ncbi:hypothetical protein N9H39_00510 [Gammaproteobacteria bacterium]|nr:hypothetical protein [Gammaproteobacteria bacterium]
MKNRIEIDGVWYTREDNTTPEVKPRLEPSIAFEGLVFESDLYCFEATRLRDDDGEFYDKECSIKFTDKKIDIDNSEYWDNAEWMIGFLNNDPEAIAEAEEALCPQGMEEFRVVVQELAGNGWI